MSVVFNGEIYNFRELRDGLRSRGHVFSTETDTEVLVHLYEERGPGLVHDLRGMFAFAIWDDRRQRLVAARDRLGIKPLHYSHSGGVLGLASEAKALVPDGAAKWNAQAMMGYLRLGWVPRPMTIFDGINELPPGHLLEWSEDRLKIKRWWEPPHMGSGEASKDNLAEVLRDSLARHLISDVPLGLFLSSGLDSIALAFLASKEGAPLHCYTAAFDVGPSESQGAAHWAARLGLPHTTVTVTGEEILDNLHRFIAELDQPTVDGLNTWVISRAVKQAGVTVALSGLGGDELFKGYSTFRRVPFLHTLGRVVSSGPPALRSALPHIVDRWLSTTVTARAVEAITEGGWPAAYASMRAVMGSSQFRRLAPGYRDTTLENLESGDRTDDVDRVLQLELRNYLPQQLLRDADVTSMAHSLEVRVPLLDDEVVKAALRFPVDRNGRHGKARLAAAVDPALLGLAAAPKRTFTLPLDSWLRSPLRSTARDALERLTEPDIGLDRWELSHLWDRFVQGRVDWRTVWALVVLGLWTDRHLPRA